MAALAASCSQSVGTVNPPPTPEDVAADLPEEEVTDLGPASMDTVAPRPDRPPPEEPPPPQDTADAGAPTPDAPAMDVAPEGGPGVCPASCATHADCDPCYTPGEPRVGAYCCFMNLCIYFAGTCGDGGVVVDTMNPPPPTDVLDTSDIPEASRPDATAE